MKTLRDYQISSRDLDELIALGDVVKVKTGYCALNEKLESLTDFELVNLIIPNGFYS